MQGQDPFISICFGGFCKYKNLLLSTEYLSYPVPNPSHVQYTLREQGSSTGIKDNWKLKKKQS